MLNKLSHIKNINQFIEKLNLIKGPTFAIFSGRKFELDKKKYSLNELFKKYNQIIQQSDNLFNDRKMAKNARDALATLKKMDTMEIQGLKSYQQKILNYIRGIKKSVHKRSVLLAEAETILKAHSKKNEPIEIETHKISEKKGEAPSIKQKTLKKSKTTPEGSKHVDLFTLTEKDKEDVFPLGNGLYTFKERWLCSTFTANLKLPKKFLSALPKGNYFLLPVSTPRISEMFDQTVMQDFIKQSKSRKPAEVVIIAFRFMKNPDCFEESQTTIEFEGQKIKVLYLMYYADSDGNYSWEDAIVKRNFQTLHTFRKQSEQSRESQ